MAKLFYESDADQKHLEGKTVAIIGLGSQGKAHASNLQDSGVNVVVGLRENSRSTEAARELGLKTAPVAEAAAEADLVMMLIPDTEQREVYLSQVQPGLKPGNALFFAHGFNIHFRQIVAPKDVDVAMIAPKGPGNMVRRTYQEGSGVPSLVAVFQDASGCALDVALAYAKALGAARAGVIETTFAEETETDLFGEQAVLCGGLTELVRSGFDTLTEAGYQPEIAYFECLHELKLIVDLVFESGIAGMRRAISDTAKYGDVAKGSHVIDATVRLRMKELLADIQSGAFAEEWIAEDKAGRPNYTALLDSQADHLIEQVGTRLRSMMSWLKK